MTLKLIIFALLTISEQNNTVKRVYSLRGKSNRFPKSNLHLHYQKLFFSSFRNTEVIRLACFIPSALVKIVTGIRDDSNTILDTTNHLSQLKNSTLFV